MTPEMKTWPLVWLIAWCLLWAFVLVHLTGCIIPGGQLDLNLKAASARCQAGDMEGCQAWTKLNAIEWGYASSGGYAAEPVYAAGPRFGMGWVTPTPVNPIQPGPIGAIPALNWGPN